MGEQTQSSTESFAVMSMSDYNLEIKPHDKCDQEISSASENDYKNIIINKKRIKVLNEKEEVSMNCDGFVYWMSRDQRVQDNWAMLYAQRLAVKHEAHLHVVFCLVPKLLEATLRHYDFMIKGLQEVERLCTKLEISFHLLLGYAKDVLPSFINDYNIGGVVTDFSPLKSSKQWIKDVLNELPNNVSFFQVDSHNIVPCWVASDIQEFSARTFRKKINEKLSEFLIEYPPVIQHPYRSSCKPKTNDWDSVFKTLDIDTTVGPVDWCKPGTEAGLEMLKDFCTNRLSIFADKRNDPNIDALSNLSPWIHFGQISAQRCILEVSKFNKQFIASVNTFIEESVVRRELSDNYCFYQDKYDSLEGAPAWAQKSLVDHRDDKRDYVYTVQSFEDGETHDYLWNAAQLQMVKDGKMHGFLRMYWAKKILEWSPSPEAALSTAIYLNDKYSMDGRDPNGYVGIMWSICGLHDQGWAERKVFGKVRYMNFEGCRRKFDVPTFVKKYCKDPLPQLPPPKKSKKGD